MLDVMIIDDDLPIRDYLRNVIEWERLGLRLVCEAGDSETARELYATYHPRLIVTDISIPIISGLELAREFIQKDRELRIIVITGFSDFENVRDSVSLGAIDLLAKPIIPEEINASLKKAVDYFEELQKRYHTHQALNALIAENLSVLQERSIAQLFSRPPQTNEAQLHENLKLLSLSFPDAYFVVVRICLELESAGELGGAAFPTAFQKLCEDQFVSNGFHAFTFFGAENRLDCLIGWSAAHGHEQLENLLEKLLEETRFYFQRVFFAGIGNTVTELGALYTSAEQASLALQFSDATCPHIVNYRNLDKIAAPRIPCNEQLLLQLTGYIRTFRFDAFCGAVDAWLETPEAQEDAEYRREFALEFLSKMSGTCYSTGIYPWREMNYPQTIAAVFRVQSGQDMRALLLTAGEQLIKILFRQRAKSTNQLIRLAKAYIQENISDPDLSVDTVSSHIGLSKNYFSQLFHKEEKISFNTYLNAERIHLAQELLQTTNKKVFEVSDLVGYSNPKYFNYVFKRTVGLTPLDWRKKIPELH